MPVDTQKLSIEFAEAFCSSDLARMESLLAPDLRLRGPLFQFDSRAEYLRALKSDAPEPSGCEIVHVHGTEIDSAILYEYQKKSGPLLIAQFNRFEGNLIVEVTLVFDSAAVSHGG